MVISLHRCSYDNSTISSVNNLKQYDTSLLSFPSFTFLSFTFLFHLFFKFMSNMSKSRFIESPGHQSESKLHIISQRERENRRSPVVRVGWVVRWCLENIQSQSVLLIWIIVGQGSIALAVGGGCLDIFFSRLSFLFSFSLFGRRSDID